MKGYYKPLSTTNIQRHSVTYSCDHPLFDSATLFKEGDFGLLVIQKKFNAKFKVSFWGPIDPWLSNDIYEEHGFIDVFNKLCDTKDDDGLYPVIEVRKLMYELGMKPMRKEIWEKY